MNATLSLCAQPMAWVAGAALAFGSAHTSVAATIPFTQITNNGALSPAAQLTAEVSDSGGQVLFKFVNDGAGISSRISEVYWDDDLGLLSNGPTVDGSSTSGGVDLSDIPASPANLPSGNTISFAADFSAGRRMAAANGVDPGEMAGFLFDGTLADVEAALGSGDLRLGLHVISIQGDGQSESFVSHPEPTTLALLALGGVALSVTRRTR